MYRQKQHLLPCFASTHCIYHAFHVYSPYLQKFLLLRARARVASLRAELAAQRGAQAAAEAAVADATRSLQVLHTQQRDMQQRAWVVGEEADQQVVAAYQVPALECKRHRVLCGVLCI